MDAVLGDWAEDDTSRSAVASTLQRLATAAVAVAGAVGDGSRGAAFARSRGSSNAAGDSQRELDVFADDQFLGALRSAPVALYASEELAAPAILDPDAPLAVAIDPLDGSSNIDVNVSIGTIFSILPLPEGSLDDPMLPFAQTGRAQLAAGFFIYGPQTNLVLTLGEGVAIFSWSARREAFLRIAEDVQVHPRTREFAINASNYRHWEEPVRLYFDDCIMGGHGPREEEFNMRWIASLVAETYRILIRGGVFLYPGDKRRGYSRGRLRLVYEAAPIAMIVEQAGGSATDCVEPILDIAATELHQRVPFVFGTGAEVRRIGRYHTRSSGMPDRAPLFGKRTLFQA